MSASLSAAKKRRAPPATPVDVGRPGTQSNNVNTPQGLTLPQVISLIDKRLIHLESLTKSMQSNVTSTDNVNNGNFSTIDKTEIMNELNEQFDAKFDIMASEIADLKNIIMSLQAYTMDVNKMLLQQLQASGMTTYQLGNDPTIMAIGGEDAPVSEDSNTL